MNKKQKMGFILSMVFSSFFLAHASLSAVAGEPELMFLSSLFSWFGYLSGHKIIEGTFIDGKDPDRNSRIVPEDAKLMIGTLGGSGVLILGMVVGVRGLRQQSLEITFPAALLFIGGYVLAHYAGTGDLL